MQIKGIDVSKHQGKINWSKVKESDIEFVMIRVGFGKNNIDEQFKANAKGCADAGIPFGGYWFSYAYTEEMARQEAKYCLAALSPYQVSYPIAFDLEYDTIDYAKQKGVTIGKNLATAMAIAFCQEIEAAGYHAMNYANQDYLNTMFGQIPYDLWYAKYASAPGRDAAIWQYSSKGTISGIPSTSVDLNICYKNYLAASQQGNWIKEDGKYWYQYTDGSYPAKAWDKIDGLWYYFDDRGWMAESTWIGNYYVGSDGAMLANTSTPDGYYVDETGKWDGLPDDWIKRLQEELKNQGYNPGPIDNKKGVKTLAACPTLRKGHKGGITKLVQERLQEHFLIGVPGGIDGVFGDGMGAAVQELQHQKKLKEDRVIGKDTWRALLEM